MNEKCRRLLEVLETIRKGTQPVPWLSNPQAIDDGWKVVGEIVQGISDELQKIYGK